MPFQTPSAIWTLPPFDKERPEARRLASWFQVAPPNPSAAACPCTTEAHTAGRTRDDAHARANETLPRSNTEILCSAARAQSHASTPVRPVGAAHRRGPDVTIDDAPTLDGSERSPGEGSFPIRHTELLWWEGPAPRPFFVHECRPWCHTRPPPRNVPIVVFAR